MTSNHPDNSEMRHRTPQERAERGKAVRSSVPRSSHAEFAPTVKRPDPVDIIEAQSATRVPELVPIRYGRMTESPFRFYRGAAAIMAGDLADTPVSGIRAQLCGDAHLLNFRLLASPERRMMFDINDFDETLPGPWEWDVKRLSASFVIAGRANGFSTKERAGIVRATVRSYREWMRRFAKMGNLAVWYAQFDEAWVREHFGAELSARGRDRWSQAVTKARSRDGLQAFGKLTHIVDGQVRIAAVPPLITPLQDLLQGVERDALEKEIHRLIERYGRTLQSDRRSLLEQYRVADMARKVVGVGSVGTRCYVVLLQGKWTKDALFLQIKQAEASVLEPHLAASSYGNHGQRVVNGQRLLQALPDIFLGWSAAPDGNDYYVRELWDMKGGIDPSKLTPGGLSVYAGLCGWTLARAHGRGGDEVAIAAYLGKGDVFDNAIARFAVAYADVNDRDHKALAQAVEAGRIQAVNDL
jgi:hypothetical protein